MGYYTAFSLDFYGDDEKVRKAVEDLKVTGDDDAIEAAERGFVHAKWYDYGEQIQKVAEMNPDVLIVVSGDGEDSDDNWEERYKGKLYERQDACIPPFVTPELRIP